MAKTISKKFKQLGQGLKEWSKYLLELGKLINNCNWVISMIDGREEQRALSRTEFMFITSVKAHMANLLEGKRKYWKQQATIRWAKFGDENFAFFFQLMATIAHRSFISLLQLPDGTLITDHNLKAGLLWSAFKE